jgi:hypothetical protein
MTTPGGAGGERAPWGAPPQEPAEARPLGGMGVHPGTGLTTGRAAVRRAGGPRLDSPLETLAGSGHPLASARNRHLWPAGTTCDASRS